MMYCRVVEYRYYFCYPFSVVYNVGGRLHSLWTRIIQRGITLLPQVTLCSDEMCIQFMHLFLTLVLNILYQYENVFRFYRLCA
jgi:hypothetical protein